MGVWFANRPLEFGERANDDPSAGAPVLAIDLDVAAIADYEVTMFPEAYREWYIPAHLANAHLLGVIYEPEKAGWDEAWWEAAEPKSGTGPAIRGER